MNLWGVTLTERASKMKRKTHFSTAATVQDELVEKLGTPDWLYGIGVGHDDEKGFFVSVRIAQKTKAPKLPRSIKGVRIRIERRKEMPHAL